MRYQPQWSGDVQGCLIPTDTAPVDKKGEEVGCADGAVAVERSKNPRPRKAEGVMVGTGRLAPLRTRPPVGEEGEEVGEHGYQFEIIEVLAEVR